MLADLAGVVLGIALAAAGFVVVVAVCVVLLRLIGIILPGGHGDVEEGAAGEADATEHGEAGAEALPDDSPAHRG